MPDRRREPAGSARAGRHRPGGPEQRPLRADIEGLRAVAVGLVILYHIGLSYLPGGFVGVDVFFVISGFLITTQLVSELNRDGRISLPAFYARRAKRLLPAAGTVLLTSAALVYFFVPPANWSANGGDIASAALYVVNWRLADRAVDYLAEGDAPSVVQHFWSLAVEEQFYLVWPLLILLAVVVARAAKRDRTQIMCFGLGALVVASFGWSVWYTAESPERAFFVTPTRIWELGVGAAVAMAAGAWARVPRRIAAGVSWLGLAAVAVSSLIVPTEAGWPGYAAALPTLGAAAVIAGGFAAGRGGAGLALGVRPMRWAGGMSYSLYLWHWPLIAAAMAYWGSDATTKRLLVVAAVSVVPAWLTHVLIENPFRFSRPIARSPRLALSLGANFSLLGVATGLAVVAAVGMVSAAASPGDAAGARVLAEHPRDDPAGAPVDVVDWMTPLPAKARKDLAVAYRDGCVQAVNKAEVVRCEYGDLAGELTVAVVGDSKVTQWMPALVPLAERNGWHIVTYLESGCSFARATTVVRGVQRAECRRWVDNVVGLLRADRPDWVITSQLQPAALDSAGRSTMDAMVTGLREVWTSLLALGSRIAVMADNPGPGGNVFECVERHPRRLTACAFDRATAPSGARAQLRAAIGLRNVYIVDLNDAICPTDRCAPVIGNVLIYRETSHLTATYVRTLTPRLAVALSRVGLTAADPSDLTRS